MKQKNAVSQSFEYQKSQNARTILLRARECNQDIFSVLLRFLNTFVCSEKKSVIDIFFLIFD